MLIPIMLTMGDAGEPNTPVDTFEFDVQITKDGEHVLLHNPTYDDTANVVEAFGTREMLNNAHKNNIAVPCWTINREEKIRLLAENGADCIMTDYPQRAYETIKSLEKE